MVVAHYRQFGTTARTVIPHNKHPAQKPVSLSGSAIANSCRVDGRVLDLFGGSGSTVIGCEKAARSARVLELDPLYCDVIVRRWQNFTGKKATLDGPGINFEETAEWRKSLVA